ncbi:MAG TPA: thrombospondin type 3 repeat-containing protein, partial [candidate division Zixibacteria bacterium]|nr:thrombospondin type 3 repeat-containing protein [candidate division Zixibacteria bacterium]
DLDGDGIPDSLDDDIDGDGVPNATDIFPTDPNESADLDNDGIGDNADPDRDGDGVNNDVDAFPNDAAESSDLDGDGIGDNADPDRDGDGVDNTADAFPNDPAESSDIDGDGIGDNADPDRDGDGISNDYETQAGTDPNDPTSTPPDLDGDGIPDSLDSDRDGDGVDNDTDTYPDDPSRNVLGAVNGVNAALNNTSVSVTWNAHPDSAKVSGYNVYRTTFGGTDITKMNGSVITATSFDDTTVSNGQAYVYQVRALDLNSREGDISTGANIFVAYNITPVTGLAAVRAAGNANTSLSWDALTGFRYQLYKATTGTAPASLTQATTNSYTDTTTLWDQSYDYQVASIADFTNPITSSPVSITGPLSAIVTLPAMPPLTLNIDDTTTASDGVTLERAIANQASVTITGQYQQAADPVTVTATSGGQTVNASSSDGTLRLVLPAVNASVWAITVSEKNIANRSVSVNLRLIADTVAPVVTIDGAAQRTVNEDFITVTGSVSDNLSGVSQVIAVNDRFSGQVFGVILTGSSFYVEVPVNVGDNVIQVVAQDSAGNNGSASITVTRTVTLAPVLEISTPANNSFTIEESVDVQGVVYSSQDPTQIRIVLGNQQKFAVAGSIPNVYTFTFSNIALVQGTNTITVRAETPIGNDARSVLVNRVEPGSPGVTSPIIS